MQQENREKLATILGIIMIVAVTAPIVLLTYRYWNLINTNLFISIVCGLAMFAGAVIILLFPKSKLPSLLIFIGGAEQLVMLLLYLNIKWSYALPITAAIALLVVMCITIIFSLNLDKSDEELIRNEQERKAFRPYEYVDPRYTVYTSVNEEKKENKPKTGDECAEVVDINSVRKPPMTG